MFITEPIKSVESVLARHKSAVKDALHAYREVVELCDTAYSPNFAAQKRAEAKREAAGRIAQADREMHDSIMSYARDMRRDMYGAIVEPPSVRFRETIAYWKDSKLTEIEIRALAEQAAGSYCAQRILQNLARNSGFSIAAPDASAIEKDIQKIERAARIPSMYAPGEYHAEALEVLGEKPWFRDDGSVAYYSGKPDALYLTLTAKAFENLARDMSGPMLERWKGVQPIVIEPLANAENEADMSPSEREQAKAEQAEAEQIAREEFAENLDVTPDFNEAAIMAENEASVARSREILARYTQR